MQSQGKRDKVSMVIDRLEKFDPNSSRIQNYNDELKLQIELLSSKDTKKNQATIDSQFTFILSQMEVNGVKANA